ncbi:hypothetical protein J6590_020196 [Homalodisca vitripennis]|nr:hypothetical protein J6590_020196 [Homalodisca vitripennis]
MLYRHIETIPSISVADKTTSLHSNSTTETSPESPVTALPPKPPTTMRPHSEDDLTMVLLTSQLVSAPRSSSTARNLFLKL